MLSPVCLVAPEFVGPYRNGGVGTACYWQALLLARAGEEVTVLYTGPTAVDDAASWRTFFHEEHGLAFVDVQQWAARHHPELDHLALQPEGDEMRNGLKVLAYLREHTFTTLLFQEFLGHGLRALQYRAAGLGLHHTRCVLTAHGPLRWTHQGMRQAFAGARQVQIDRMERASALLSDAVAAPSAHMADWMCRYWELPRERITVVPYAFAPGHQPEAPRTFTGFKDLIFFGRLETRKGVHFFLDALEASPLLRERVRSITFLGKPETVLGQPATGFIRGRLDPHFAGRWEILSDLDSRQVWDYLRGREDCLIVAPSLLDNLPFTVIELFQNRRPFLTTATGGIPEIVGAGNAALLCHPSGAGLRERMEAVFREDALTIDYRTGFHSDEANAAQLAFLEALAPGAREPAPETNGTVPAIWPERPGPDGIGLCLPAGATLPEMQARRLGSALKALEADAVLSAIPEGEPDKPPHGWRAPTTADLEGLLLEPESHEAPLAFRHRILDTLPAEDLKAVRGPAGLLAALLLAGARVGVLPEALGAPVPAPERNAGLVPTQLAARIGRLPPERRPDLSPLIQALQAPARRPSSVYHLLAQWAGAVHEEDTGEPSPELRAMCRRLAARQARWRDARARVAVYGIGEHTRVLLLLCPWLARHLCLFIDRRAGGSFLGLPCISPDAFSAEQADVVIYSSKAAETQMHQRLAHHAVEHVLLYT